MFSASYAADRSLPGDCFKQTSQAISRTVFCQGVTLRFTVDLRMPSTGNAPSVVSTILSTYSAFGKPSRLMLPDGAKVNLQSVYAASHSSRQLVATFTGYDARGTLVARLEAEVGDTPATVKFGPAFLGISTLTIVSTAR